MIDDNNSDKMTKRQNDVQYPLPPSNMLYYTWFNWNAM